MSDGGWYGYPQQEPDPYAQPQDDWNRPPLDYGNAAQASGYDAYGQQSQQAQQQAQYYAQQQQAQQAAAQQQAQQQAQYYAQQQAQQAAAQQQQQQAAAQQAEQAARQRAQQYRRPAPQPGASQNPYFQQQQSQQQSQQGYGYDTGGYPRQSGYERTGYDTSAGYQTQAQGFEQGGYGAGSGTYETRAAQQQPQTAQSPQPGGGRRGAPGASGATDPRRGEPRDPYAALAELSEGEEEDEYEYPNRAARRPGSTGQQARVDEGRLNLLDREEREGKPKTASADEDDEDDDDGEGRKKSRRSCLVIFLFFALIAGGLGYGGYQGYKYYEAHYGPPADYASATGAAATAIVEIPQNATGSQIGSALFDAGVVKSQRAFTNACNANSQCGNIQAATYQLHKQMSAAGALTALLNPANIYNKSQLLVKPGERASEVFADLEQKTNWTQAQIVAAVNSGKVDLPSFASAKDGAKYPFANIEGMLFTGTYQLPSYKTPTALIKAMVDQQVAMFNAIGLTQKAKSLNLTPYQVLTVASMARAEAGGNPTDLGKIAGVIYTRLKNPDFSKLGFDTATLYGLGRTNPQPTASELADKSNPYNLRVIAGLPPGPIDSVDQMALTNALAPTDHTDVFFCAVDGTVHYAANDTAWANLGKQFPGSCG